MRNEKEIDVNVHQRAAKAHKRVVGVNGGSQDIFEEPQVEPSETINLMDKFLPHGRTMRMTQEAKGVFLPYPLLGIIVTLCLVLIGGIVAIKVEVSNLSTTMLLRDADQRAILKDQKEKLDQLEVYIHDLREKRISDHDDIEQLKAEQQVKLR